MSWYVTPPGANGLLLFLNATENYADFWRAAYPAVTPGWHMNHTHWNTVEVNAGVPPEDLCEMISDSYRLTTSPARAERSMRRAKQRPQP